MFGFIKNLFGGIFGFIGRLLGLKKSEYALEFEPAGNQPAPANQPAKTEASKEKTSDRSKVVAKATGTLKEPAKASKPAAKTEPAKAEEGKSKNQKPAKESKPAAKTPAPKAEPVKSSEPVGGFSTQYLMPSVTSTRRRPGANMSPFLDMARQVKTTR